MRERGKMTVVAFSTILTIVLIIGALLGQERGSQEPYRPLAVLSEVLSRIQSDYVEDPNFDKVTEGALHGLLESLDPYSSYLTAEEYKEYQKASPGEASIGAVVSKKFGPPAVVVAVLPGSPAERAGLQSYDFIEFIDGQTTREMSYAAILARLQGLPGSTVSISVVRTGTAEREPFPIKLTREVVKIPDVEARALEAGIGYLRVVAFPKGKSDQIAAQLARLRQSGATKFILDLRDNALGEMGEGVATANLFIRRGLIAYLAGQQYPRESFIADESKAVSDEPLVVLVNESTGGPAEIVAAAIQDNHRGQIVGERTLGIGSIQKVIPMDDGSALILSVAKYFSPTGEEIQAEGVTPDFIVRQEREFLSLSEQETAPEPQQPKEDNALKRAVDLLKSADSVPQAA
jgi:carboxyl-terminal processing protease